ncbi:Leucine-rich repeat, immunoglobulin-like domain and transmembrane domain-containing protein 2 [Lonchura striata]|uniref:leucine-rich repeat, immunoglobulin-like domain and transmembrane domain-containing protein 2 n=1 Tax=Lonchura striata TaxID=40157 RepID=UPI000B4D6AF0|nr:leucine-rich repeat, immunoglobulin-like domain and transmembrane domain-containing protein 2 [Lonchura striata domestica]OWK53725.1 Leucine-rich repeat, immunoglobulin-like domain and transmembrane domain-containing protein 2 [Lonchura striata domestica]
MSALLRQIPANIPQDIRKIRIENSHLTELPRGSFENVSALEYLWLNFNNITVMHIKSLEYLPALKELRLQGNKLSSVPWTAFQDTPTLKILDLKHNRLDVLPEHALRYLPNLTYLDLSSNQLTIISRDVFYNWPVYQRSQRTEGPLEAISNAVLALHDNPWICDCRLRGFVQFIKSVGPPIILMNSYLTCSGPKFRTGKFFHEVELNSCTKPLTSALDTNLTVPAGLNITLTCFVQASPSPAVWWTYALKLLRAFNVSTEPISEDTVRSELLIPAARPADAGNYTCTAANFLGNASVAVSLRVVAPWASTTARGWAPAAAAEPGAHVEVRIAKQTVYGITLEWFAAAAAAAEPGETWYTLLVGRYDAAHKDTIYIGPGVNTYSVTDLLPATKYEVCVAVRNQAPRKGQCVVFVTGSDVSQMEQREKLIHIVVIVCAMVLAVPAGMYACTAEALPGCLARCPGACPRRRRGGPAQAAGSKESTLDSLPAGSEDGLCRSDGGARRPPDRPEPGKARPPHRNSADLY